MRDTELHLFHPELPVVTDYGTKKVFEAARHDNAIYATAGRRSASLSPRKGGAQLSHQPSLASNPMGGLATVLAIIVAFFTTPTLNEHSSEFVVDAAVQAYGYGALMFAYWGWMLAIGMMVFFLAKALITSVAKLVSSWAYLRLGSFF